jgi:hypothetical protein
MLLRRLSENLKSQSWTAVCLDLVIVILGIFLGLQVSQWYEGRQEITLEASILDRLRVEFDEISKDARTAIRFHQEEIAALEFINQSLKRGKLNPGDVDQFRSGLRNAMSYELGPSRSGTYIEILSSGRFRLLRSQDLRAALNNFDDKVLKADSLFDGFQLSQRNHEAIFNRHLTRGPVREQSFASMPTGVMFLHAEITEFDFDEMANDEEFRTSIQRLIEYHTNFQIWHSQINRSADKVLSLLEVGKS